MDDIVAMLTMKLSLMMLNAIVEYVVTTWNISIAFPICSRMLIIIIFLEFAYHNTDAGNQIRDELLEYFNGMWGHIGSNLYRYRYRIGELDTHGSATRHMLYPPKTSFSKYKTAKWKLMFEKTATGNCYYYCISLSWYLISFSNYAVYVRLDS